MVDTESKEDRDISCGKEGETEKEQSKKIKRKVQLQEPELPDGGYGWIITFASFMCHFIADGIAFTFGVIYTELVVEFKVSKSATSWIGSLFAGMPLICAPIAGLMVNRYGCRVTTIAGGIITSAGLLLSSFARSVELMSLCYGVIAGFGLAFVYVPASVIPSFWFEKKRGLVTGIAKSGTGIGTFAMAPLMEYLILTFSWRGAMIILSGITLHLVLFGALFRPIPDDEAEDEEDEDQRDGATVSNDEADYSKAADDFLLLSVRSTSTQSIPAKLSLSHECLTTITASDLIDSTPRFLDLDMSGGDENILGNRQHLIVDEKPPENVDKEEIPLPEIVHIPSTHHRRRFRRTHHHHHHHRGIPLNQLKRSTKSLLPRSKWDITSVITLAERKRFTTSAPELSKAFIDGLEAQNSKRLQFAQVMRNLAKIGREVCDVKLFKLPVYFIFFLSNFILCYAYNFPYVYLPDYADDQRVDNPSFLISIIGIVNMIGQILYGYLGDHRKCNTIVLYGLSIVVCGVLVAVIPAMHTYGLLATTCGLFGLLISANFSLECIVLVKILSLEELTKAYSLLMFGQGVATLMGPPIGGLLWDLTHTYTATFVFSGVSLFVSGLLVLAILFFERGKRSRSRRSSFSSDTETSESQEDE